MAVVADREGSWRRWRTRMEERSRRRRRRKRRAKARKEEDKNEALALPVLPCVARSARPPADAHFYLPN